MSAPALAPFLNGTVCVTAVARLVEAAAASNAAFILVECEIDDR